MMNANMIAGKLIKGREVEMAISFFLLHDDLMIKAFVPQSEKCIPIEYDIYCISGHRIKYFPAEDMFLL